MVKYENGKIYRLVCNVTGLQYIGSTCSTLSHRKGEHKANYNQYLHGKKHFITSFEVLKGGDYDIVLIENYPCNDKNELLARERYYIETMECVNKIKPSRTKIEYYEQNKDRMKNHMKQNYENNKTTRLEQAKKTYETNKEEILDKRKKSYEENKENLLSKVLCECGVEVNKSSLNRHKKTSKHKKLLSKHN